MTTVDNSQINACFKHPFSMIIAGPSQSGKTEFIIKFLEQSAELIDIKLEYIVWFYGEDTPQHQKLLHLNQPKLHFVHNIPEHFDDYILPNKKGMFILDDLMNESSNSVAISNLFVKGVHHKSVSLIYSTQDIFSFGNMRKNFLRNANYFVLFKTPLDQTIPSILARRILPHNPNLFLQIFHKATEKTHGYLLCDGHQSTPKEARFRSDIFDGTQKIYII